MFRTLSHLGGLLVILLLFTAACQPIQPTNARAGDATNSRQANQAVVQRFYEEVFTQKNMPVLGEIFAENFVAHDLDDQELPAGLEETLVAFPDIKATVNQWVIEGELVTAIVTYQGTHQAEFLGVAATGKAVTFAIIDVWRVQDGVITELWHDIPNEEILEQIQPVSDAASADPMTNSEVTITVDEAGMQAPDELPNGLVKLVLQNSGQALRAIFISRLAADETVQESLQFLPGAPGSKSTLIGAAFLHPGARYESVLQLPTGNYYAVDIMATTPVVDEFVVGESTRDSTTAPTAAVQVTAQEFAFVMPDAIAAGASWWQIENQGKQPHDLTLYKLENGMTLDKLMETLIATEVGRPEPLSFPSVAHWVMGAGQTNWVNFDLAAGEYVVVSMTPDLSTMPPDATQADFTKGMVHGLTVK